MTGTPLHLGTERLLLPPLGGGHAGALAEIHADPGNRPSRALAARPGSRIHRTDTTPSGAPAVVHERFAPPTPAGCATDTRGGEPGGFAGVTPPARS